MTAPDRSGRIVRDYEKYITRQFKRGTSRQELNVSWLKKNELDLKRQVNELRDNIKYNWSTTGQELSKELKQFWQNSRSGSPARGLSRNASEHDLHGNATSPTAVSHLAHLEIPSKNNTASNDFLNGYSLGLIGGVRSWVSLSQLPSVAPWGLKCKQMTRRRVSLRGSRPTSPGSSDEESDAKSPASDKAPIRGRKGELVDGGNADAMDTAS
jgi:choline-phosphate cytidylyltransferase